MALNSTNFSDLEVLQRKLQRLLSLCRALKNSGTFGMLCQIAGQNGATIFELETEFTRLLALTNAGSILSADEIECHASWIDFHLQAFEDIRAATLFFEEFPSGHAAHVA